MKHVDGRTDNLSVCVHILQFFLQITCYSWTSACYQGYHSPKNKSWNTWTWSWCKATLVATCCRWSETTSLNCGHQLAYCSSPRWHLYMSIEHGGMISTGENSWFVHQSSLAILPAESHSRKSGGTDEGNDEFGLTKYLYSYSAGIFNML
jgi:hypothetical protein